MENFIHITFDETKLQAVVPAFTIFICQLKPKINPHWERGAGHDDDLSDCDVYSLAALSAGS